MGRRSIISATAVKRMISAINSQRKENARIDLINSQYGTSKESEPEYCLLNVDFNPETRVTKLEILQSQEYRTIDRYVTQNYVRYPIYSDWKKRTKIIKKTIKLTNSVLESLDENEDEYIEMFAKEIVVALSDENLYPSWFYKLVLQNEYQEKSAALDEEKNLYRESINLKINGLKQEIDIKKSENAESTEILTKKLKKKKTLSLKINKIEQAKKSIILNIITLFIYSVYNSDSRKQKLTIKITKIQNEITSINESINQRKSEIKELKSQIQLLNEDYSAKKADIQARRDKNLKEWQADVRKITPLPCGYSENADFLALTALSGLGYEKIIGCYVIHNKFNDKCYVGQSKDVIKRLRQHFKGTVPNNIIFAEDYTLLQQKKGIIYSK